MSILIDYLPWFLGLLTVLVFVHEMGHYLAARAVGVHADAFSIGFGPELFGWTDRANTRWKISAIPLGGYVKMFGEGAYSGGGEGGRPLTEEERKVSFSHKKLWARAAIVFAGPASNYVFAIIVLAGLFMTIGQPNTPATVGTVLEGSAAAEAGIQPGDEFLVVGGSKIERFRDVQRVVQLRPGEPLDIGRKTRVVPAALRRFLRHRDRGCRFPGCTRRRHFDAHHIAPWADGGGTSGENLVLLCRNHHRTRP